jgi:hypothetical protein
MRETGEDFGGSVGLALRHALVQRAMMAGRRSSRRRSCRGHALTETADPPRQDRRESFIVAGLLAVSGVVGVVYAFDRPRAPRLRTRARAHPRARALILRRSSDAPIPCSPSVAPFTRSRLHQGVPTRKTRESGTGAPARIALPPSRDYARLHAAETPPHIQDAVASSIDSSTLFARPLSDLSPILGQMELCERIECRRGDRRQPHQVGLVLLREISLEPVGGLDEPVVRAV